MTRGGSRARRTRGRGRALVTPLSFSPSSSVPPPLVVPPPIVSPSIGVVSGSPAASPIPSPLSSTGPPTSSSAAGSSIRCDLPSIHVENERLIPSHACSSSMKKIFTQRIYPDGYTWKNVPNEYKESYFEEFKKFYKWDESIDKKVHKAFLTQAGIRYTYMVSKFKAKRTSTGRPACLSEKTWRIWEAYWDRPYVKAKSEQQRKNRLSEVAGPGTGCSRHTGGSRSAIEHYHKLRDELQNEPNLFECFNQMHKKKKEEIQARHDVATQEAEGSTEPPTINMYVNVVSGVKKQRIYGLGTKASSFINENGCNSSATSQLHQNAMKEMVTQQLETMRAEIQAQLQAERTRMQAQMQAQIQAQVQAQITSLMDELRRNGMLPTSMPRPPTIQVEHSANSNAKNLGDD